MKPMKALLDTNIIIHREANRVLNENIGKLYYWLEKLNYKKCVHKLSIEEIDKYKGEEIRRAFGAKLKNYSIIENSVPMDSAVEQVGKEYDVTDNDVIDTKLLNELYVGRVDLFITEDAKIFKKAHSLGISDKVRSIDGFLEWAITENPELQDYNVKNIRIEKFGAIDLKQSFFDSLRESYNGFDKWYLKNYDEEAYVCGGNNELHAFLALKVEGNTENYSDIVPTFTPKKRLKVRTLKVVANGYKIGERFIKIIFDNAINNKVEEIYVTLFADDSAREELKKLFVKFGFTYWGLKGAREEVYVRSMQKNFNAADPFLTYPFYAVNRDIYMVTINQQYHTQLFPDSILQNENPADFKENKSFANAIHKCYITNAYSATPKCGDILLFYRSGGGNYKSVVTTIGIVSNYINAFKDFNDFYSRCTRRGALTRAELENIWNRNYYSNPKIIEFAYVETLSKKLNLQTLSDLGFNRDLLKKGIIKISKELFDKIIEASCLDKKRYI